MTFALIRGESYKQDRTYESLLNSMYFRGILFCFASALSFKQHETKGCEAKPCPLLNIALQFVLSSILEKNLVQLLLFIYFKCLCAIVNSDVDLMKLHSEEESLNLQNNILFCKYTKR